MMTRTKRRWTITKPKKRSEATGAGEVSKRGRPGEMGNAYWFSDVLLDAQRDSSNAVAHAVDLPL